MIDSLSLSVIQDTCAEYNWLFVSSDRQINNGTAAIVINGDMIEIAQDFSIRKRKYREFNPTSNQDIYSVGYLTNEKFISYLKALKYLINRFGPDRYNCNPLVKIKYELVAAGELVGTYENRNDAIAAYDIKLKELKKNADENQYTICCSLYFKCLDKISGGLYKRSLVKHYWQVSRKYKSKVKLFEKSIQGDDDE